MARDAYEAFRNKDIPAVMQLMTDDIVFEVPSKSIQLGTFKGKSEVGRYFTIIGKHTAETHTLEVLDVFATRWIRRFSRAALRRVGPCRTGTEKI